MKPGSNGRLLHLVMAAVMLAALLPANLAKAEAELPVDVELVLAADVSGSMTEDLRAAQRAGFVAAFRDPRVQAAITHGLLARVAVTYVEWSGRDRQTMIVPWRLIASRADAEAFATELEGAGATDVGPATAIFAALSRASLMFDLNGYAGERLVIDVSGNGPENSGDRPILLGDGSITVNGLIFPVGENVVEDPYRDYPYTTSDVVRYFREMVVQGPGGFAIRVETARDIDAAIIRKLVLEIAGPVPRERLTREGHVLPAAFRPASR